MRAVRTLTTLLVTIAGLSLAAPLTAHAETTVRQDRRDDAPARIDVARARYSYGPDRVTVLARIPNLGRRGDASFSFTRFEVFEAGYVVRIVKRAGQAPRVGVYYFDHFGLSRRPCARVSGRWAQDSIRLVAPTPCLQGHARERAFVQFGIRAGRSVDRAPAVRRLSRG